MYLRMGVAVKENVPAWPPVTSEPGPDPTLTRDRPRKLHIASALRSVGPVSFTGRPWGRHRAGAGRLGKDIDEDLTGEVPELGVGVDTPEQRLPQGLG